MVSFLAILATSGGLLQPAAAKLYSFYDSIQVTPSSPTASLGPESHVFTWVICSVAALGLSWVAIDTPRLMLKSVVCVATLLLIVGLSPTLALYGVLFEPISAVLAGALAFVLGLLYFSMIHGRRRQSLSTMIGSRVSPRTFQHVVDSANQLNLEGEQHRLTVLSCRILNHYEMSSKLECTDLVEITNLFLNSTVEHLLSTGGYLDDSSPSGVRFLFGLDDDSPKSHALAAAQAALELRQRLHNLSRECEARWHQQFQFGIGLSTGMVTLGVFGSASHVYFSGVSAEFDLADRLCRANERYGSRILLSAQTHLHVGRDMEARPLDLIYFPKAKIVGEVYELLSYRDELSDAEEVSRDIFSRAMVYFRNGNYESALELFIEARTPNVTDQPLEYYIRQTQEYLVHPDRIPAEMEKREKASSA
ncbi:MAG: hypothetical protein AAGA96_02340 [Verrucomicrobiota bacterium]